MKLTNSRCSLRNRKHVNLLLYVESHSRRDNLLRWSLEQTQTSSSMYSNKEHEWHIKCIQNILKGSSFMLLPAQIIILYLRRGCKISQTIPANKNTVCRHHHRHKKVFLFWDTAYKCIIFLLLSTLFATIYALELGRYFKDVLNI